MKKIGILSVFIIASVIFAACSSNEELPGEETVQQETVEYDITASEYYQTVYDLLSGESSATKKAKLIQSVTNSDLPEDQRQDTVSYIFSQLCSEFEINPVAGFNSLVKNGMYELVSEEEGFTVEFATDVDVSYELNSLAFLSKSNDYEYSVLGCQSLIKDILTLSSINSPTTGMEKAITASMTESDGNGKPSVPDVYFSENDKCYYTYFVYTREKTANVLCFYIRSEDNSTISDVEFQLLNLTYTGSPSMGDGVRSAYRENEEMMSIISLISCTEQILTGSSYFDFVMDGVVNDLELTVVSGYTLGEYTSSVKSVYYNNPEVVGRDSATLVTYRLKK